MIQGTLHRTIMWKQSNQRANQTQWIIQMIPDPVKRKARDQDRSGAGNPLDYSIFSEFRAHQNDRVRDELTPRELGQAEEQIIKTAQQDCSPDEIQTLKDNKPLPNNSTLLMTSKLYGELLRSNARLRYSDDLPEETKFPVIIPKNHIVTKLIVKYHHKTEGHEMEVNFTFARKVLCCSR